MASAHPRVRDKTELLGHPKCLLESSTTPSVVCHPCSVACFPCLSYPASLTPVSSPLLPYHSEHTSYNSAMPPQSVSSNTADPGLTATRGDKEVKGHPRGQTTLSVAGRRGKERA